MTMSTDKNEVFKKLEDIELLTLVMYGEARGEGLDGMLAVGSVVLNRVKQKVYGNGIKGVILKKYQFSTFNERDPNRESLIRIAFDFKSHLESFLTLRAGYWVAKGLLEGYLHSNVGDANHYNTKGVDPKWDDNMTLIRVIGNHEFFEGR